MSITLDGTTGITTPAVDSSGSVSGSPVRGGLVSGTAVASTSGTSIDFTGIPSWAKRITVMLSGVSLNGSSNILIRLGASGAPAITGYFSTSALSSATNQVLSTSSPTGFVVFLGNTVNTFIGAMTFTNISGNTWVGTQGGYVAGFAASGGGNVSLGGTLDIVRITTVNGTDTFDAGTINIMYEG